MSDMSSPFHHGAFPCPDSLCNIIFATEGGLNEHLTIVHATKSSSKIEIRSTSSTGGQKGVKLERFDLIPTGPLAELARHYGVGAKKYAAHQWRHGYEWSKSYSAIQRHLNAFWGGEDYDVCPENGEGCSYVTNEGLPFEDYIPDVSCYNHTGNHHMAAVAWHAFCLLEFKDQFPEHDDRYKT